MSEHPLERKIKDWLGSRPSFSTQFCTDTMRGELVDYFKNNDLSQDDVCKLFGQKWQRRPALLKKQLQVGLKLGSVNFENISIFRSKSSWAYMDEN